MNSCIYSTYLALFTYSTTTAAQILTNARSAHLLPDRSMSMASLCAPLRTSSLPMALFSPSLSYPRAATCLDFRVSFALRASDHLEYKIPCRCRPSCGLVVNVTLQRKHHSNRSELSHLRISFVALTAWKCKGEYSSQDGRRKLRHTRPRSNYVVVS